MRKIAFAAFAAFALTLSITSAPAQAAASHNDSAVLSTDTAFQNRVRESVLSTCIAIANEGFAIVNHKKRADFCAVIVVTPETYKVLFTDTIATDASVLADATAAGTVALTTGNVAAQAALVTDAHMDAAISAEFNTFLILP